MKQHPLISMALPIGLLLLSSCHHPMEKSQYRFHEAMAGTWEIRSIAYPSPDTVITYGINPPLIIWEACEVDIHTSTFCPGEIRDQEGDILPILYKGSLDRSDQTIGGVQMVRAGVVPTKPQGYTPSSPSPQFNDSLSLNDIFSLEIRGDSLTLSEGNIAGDSIFVRDVEVVAVRRE